MTIRYSGTFDNPTTVTVTKVICNTNEKWREGGMNLAFVSGVRSDTGGGAGGGGGEDQGGPGQDRRARDARG